MLGLLLTATIHPFFRFSLSLLHPSFHTKERTCNFPVRRGNRSGELIAAQFKFHQTRHLAKESRDRAAQMERVTEFDPTEAAQLAERGGNRPAQSYTKGIKALQPGESTKRGR